MTKNMYASAVRRQQLRRKNLVNILALRSVPRLDYQWKRVYFYSSTTFTRRQCFYKISSCYKNFTIKFQWSLHALLPYIWHMQKKETVVNGRNTVCHWLKQKEKLYILSVVILILCQNRIFRLSDLLNFAEKAFS